MGRKVIGVLVVNNNVPRAVIGRSNPLEHKEVLNYATLGVNVSFPRFFVTIPRMTH